MNINASQLIEAVEKADRLLRPDVVIINPETFEILIKEDPDIEKKAVFYQSFAVDKNTCYVMKRSDFENLINVFDPEIKTVEF